MDRISVHSRLNLLPLLLLFGGLALSTPLELVAQVPLDENGVPLAALDDGGYAGEAIQDIAPLTTTELEELLGPVALYPDDLLAIVLPASTYPLEIVQAARFLDDLATDGSLEPDESWDESVVALLNYPEVVYMMDKEIDWTWRLGEAVLNQQADVIAAVESFRDRAYAAGNLESDEYQTVSNNNGAIEIALVDEEIIYVPYYEPEEVVVYQPRRVYHYYPQAYPVYYYPYPVGYSFASGYFWGVTTAFTIGWSNHYLHVYHPSYWGHPYYGHHYYGHYYRHSSISLYNSWYVHNSYRTSNHHHRDGDHWRPRHRSGARPATRSVRNQHYPSGGSDHYRSETRSSGRTRLDGQDRTRTQISASNSFRPRTSGATPTRISSDANRTSRSGPGTSGRSEIRFRNRSDADRVRARRDRNSGRSSNSNRNNTATNSASRQQLTAQNSRRTTANTRVSQRRQTPQRAVPTRQATNSGTSLRSSASQRQTSQRPASRPVVQRQVSRPTVQRQAPVQRQISRPTVQRQAPVQRSAPSVAPQRSPAVQPAAPPRANASARPQRQASSARAGAQRQRQH